MCNKNEFSKHYIAYFVFMAIIGAQLIIYKTMLKSWQIFHQTFLLKNWKRNENRGKKLGGEAEYASKQSKKYVFSITAMTAMTWLSNFVQFQMYSKLKIFTYFT